MKAVTAVGALQVVGGQALGVVAGLVVGLTLFAGGALAALWATEGQASHAGVSVVHACVNAFTGQARIMLPGRAAICTSYARLVERPGAGLGGDFAGLEARIDDTDAGAALPRSRASLPWSLAAASPR